MPFTETSMTGTGITVFVIIIALHALGIFNADNQVAQIVQNVVQIASFVLMVWGQARRPDISGFLFKVPA